MTSTRHHSEVELLDRDAPVARLEPPAGGDARGVRERLIGAGLLTPGTGSAAAILESPPLALPAGLSEALAEDRADRRLSSAAGLEGLRTQA